LAVTTGDQLLANGKAKTGALGRLGREKWIKDPFYDRFRHPDSRIRNGSHYALVSVELREANTRLETTNQQLIVAEKPATIGEITARIAHEINNPIVVIQGNMDVIRRELGASAAPLETELALLDVRVHSINVLVNKLLQFARP